MPSRAPRVPMLLAATWSEGVFVFDGAARSQELAGRSVGALVQDEHGVLAIVDGHTLWRREAQGWRQLLRSDFGLASLALARGEVYLGTRDARVLRVAADGALQVLSAFDDVAGRDAW